MYVCIWWYFSQGKTFVGTLKHYRASSRRLRDFTISEQCHWELNFYKTYNLLYSYCTLIYCENSSPIYLSKNPILHSYINIYI